MKSKECNSQ